MRRLRVPDAPADAADGHVDVSVGDDEVERSIQIEVGEAATESERVARWRADTRLHGNVSVEAGPERPVETDHFVVEVSDGQRGASGLIELRGIGAHAGPHRAVGAEGDARLDR